MADRDTPATQWTNTAPPPAITASICNFSSFKIFLEWTKQTKFSTIIKYYYWDRSFGNSISNISNETFQSWRHDNVNRNCCVLAKSIFFKLSYYSSKIIVNNSLYSRRYFHSQFWMKVGERRLTLNAVPKKDKELVLRLQHEIFFPKHVYNSLIRTLFKAISFTNG